ncbi:DUF3043 domain-containing protein [Brevibacterium daeguense]|uniref:DUF3043 domain-containing protein n=1 Tax=Brevibacterium daeguense TaxID=909936 RepID=UPI001F44F3AA
MNPSEADPTPEDAAAASPESTSSNPAEAKKNRPTPKRTAQEAARRQPLVPEDRREANRRAKDEIRRDRDRARAGVMQGDERYLTTRDRGPQRRFVRDYVDARFSIGELFIPVALVVLILGMFGGPQFQLIANIVVYGLLALVILDSFVLNYQVKGKLADKFGGRDKLEKGLTFYAVMRAIQMRPLRIPKPQVKRGQYPS